MVRNYKRKKPSIDIEKLKSAVLEVRNTGTSIKAAAEKFGLPRMTLSDWVKRNESSEEKSPSELVLPNRGHKTVLGEKSEKALVDYLHHCCKIYYGLSAKQVRRLVLNYAEKLDLAVPKSWKEAGMAGEDWLSSFLKRNKNLSIRKPEATSLARATSFNKTNTALFFGNLKEIIDRLSLSFVDIWNMDETGVTTVQTPDRVLARRGVKQIGRLTSGERGTLVTMALAISASGRNLPPFFVFPRKKFHDHFLHGGPPGCIGVANPSGWMTSTNFVEFLKFFHLHVRASKQHPVLLLLDNHESHLTIEGLEFCAKNGIHLLSLPPHCSHKLQPLDRTVYGPFKKAFNASSDNWMTNHPGNTIKINNIPEIVANALPLAATYKNITPGFACTGIYPFNPEIFQDVDYLPSAVTDRVNPAEIIPDAVAAVNIAVPSTSKEVVSVSTPASEPASSSTFQNSPRPNHTNEHSSSSYDHCGVILQSLQPFPKAPPRKETRRGRKRRRSQILTDSPIRRALAAEQEISKQRKAVKTTSPKPRGRPRKQKVTEEPCEKKLLREEPGN